MGNRSFCYKKVLKIICFMLCRWLVVGQTLVTEPICRYNVIYIFYDVGILHKDTYILGKNIKHALSHSFSIPLNSYCITGHIRKHISYKNSSLTDSSNKGILLISSTLTRSTFASSPICLIVLRIALFT